MTDDPKPKMPTEHGLAALKRIVEAVRAGTPLAAHDVDRRHLSSIDLHVYLDFPEHGRVDVIKATESGMALYDELYGTPRSDDPRESLGNTLGAWVERRRNGAVADTRQQRIEAARAQAIDVVWYARSNRLDPAAAPHRAVVEEKYPDIVEELDRAHARGDWSIYDRWCGRLATLRWLADGARGEWDGPGAFDS